eukprot:TRINITY_DN62107_c0_g1_i1.p2 TRINITY_DN62107_c0_g1~~TRINITY_DN62107_c0_g1_i1.p2  ORF type:complete len:154 (-),score=23.41 TRINITY_DN62107_c0_g1_i1:11-472(-)
MVLMLPPQKQGWGTKFHNWFSSLDAAQVQNERHACHKMGLNLWVPKLDLKMKWDLIAPFTALGAEHMFQATGDWERMYGPQNEESLVTAFEQHVQFKMDEEGTEAVAVTFRTITASSGGPVHVNAQFDRPYALFLQEAKSGTVLFMGVVVHPV